MSGSKIICAVAAAALATSCGLFESLGKGKPRMPEDREAGQTAPPVDTPKQGPVIVLADTADLEDTVAVDELALIAIRDRDLPAGPDGAVVSLVLPFLSRGYAGSTTSLPQNSDWALEYYAGFKLGLEALERQGERVTVHVFDTQGDAGVGQRLIADPDLRNSHAIVGPYLTDVARAVATPAQAALLPLLVPFSAAANLTEGYPRLVQLNPGLPSHLDAVAAYLSEAYDPGQVVLVGLPNGAQNGAIRYLKQRQRELSVDAPTPWRTWQLETDDVGLQGLEWEDKFAEGEPTVFVFPEYRNPKIVAAFLSQLQIGRGENDATVVGMPQWAEFQTLDPSIMEDLGVSITSGLRLDEGGPGTETFAATYIERFGSAPTLAAALGYDAVRYVVPLANRYGRAWVEHLPPRFPGGLASDYRLQPVYGPLRVDSLGNELEAEPLRYENRDVDVMTFRDYEFQAVE